LGKFSDIFLVHFLCFQGECLGVLVYPTEGLPNVYSTVLKNNFGKWLRGRYTHSENTSKSKSAWANVMCQCQKNCRRNGGGWWRWFRGRGNVNTGSSVKWVVPAGVVWSLRQSVACEPGAELSETFWRQPSTYPVGPVTYILLPLRKNSRAFVRKTLSLKIFKIYWIENCREHRTFSSRHVTLKVDF